MLLILYLLYFISDSFWRLENKLWLLLKNGKSLIHIVTHFSSKILSYTFLEHIWKPSEFVIQQFAKYANCLEVSQAKQASTLKCSDPSISITSEASVSTLFTKLLLDIWRWRSDQRCWRNHSLAKSPQFKLKDQDISDKVKCKSNRFEDILIWNSFSNTREVL